MNEARKLVDLLRSKQATNKSLGQHFLISDAMIALPIGHAKVHSDDHVLEIGPGPGVLTQQLLKTGCKVTAIEIDDGIYNHLMGLFKSEIDSGLLTLIHGDVLTHAWPKDVSKIVANIPYQISSPLIDKMTKHIRNTNTDNLECAVLLVQEEFGERMVMEYESDVGPLGMNLLLDWQCKLKEKVAPHNFSPSPRVNSRFVEMIPSDEQFPCDKRLVAMVISKAFTQRRKKLRTSLKSPPKRVSRISGWHSSRWKDALVGLSQDSRLDARPEEFDFDDWIDFCTDLEEFGN